MKLNLPNKLTLLRLAFIPFFMFFIIYPVFGEDKIYLCRIIATLLYSAASITDFLDGYIARKKNLITDFGKFMDPLADKFLVFGGFFALSFSDFIFPEDVLFGNAHLLENIFFWAAVIVIFRELAVTSMRLVVVQSAGTVVAASKIAKVKTTTQIICTIIILLEPLVFPFADGFLSLASIIIMLIFTIWSGVDYFRVYWKYLVPTK